MPNGNHRFSLIVKDPRVFFSFTLLELSQVIIIECLGVVKRVVKKMDKIIEIKDLSFEYEAGLKTINHISFDINKGDYVAILGHNGSGKSTIAKLLIGLLEKKSGSIIINGYELNLENLYKVRDNIGIVFQNPDNQFIGQQFVMI